METLGLPTSFNTTCPRCGKLNEVTSPFCERCRADIRGYDWSIKGSRPCLYCDYTGRMSEEHVFGNWIYRKYCRTGGTFDHELRRPVHIGFDQPQEFKSRIIPTRPPYGAVVYNVCSSCNNGWMSTLHMQAGRLLDELAAGHFRPLSKVEQDLVSRWTAMVSINLHCHGRFLATSRNQRESLAQGQVSSGWRVWIGRSAHPGWGGNHHTRVGPLQIQIVEDRFIPFVSCFFCIEHFWVRTLCTYTEGLLDILMFMEGISEKIDNFFQIWPSNQFNYLQFLRGWDSPSIARLQNELFPTD